MKKILACLTLLALGLSAGAYAQTSTPAAQDSSGAHAAKRPMDPQQRANQLAKRLQLNTEQTNQIAAILSNRQQQLQSLKSDRSVRGADRRAKAQAIMKDGDTQLQAVLTDNQRQRYLSMREAMIERRQEKEGAKNEPTTPMPDNAGK
ncbi:hypothetical protein [Dyella koreensis]|uniref:Periplasmic heavy metal sensor n=1 Tax=Dyella koreensis TaxID=311235 RepID=A0ABW8JYH2_9GAMM